MLIEKKIRQYIERHPLTPETLRDAKKLNEVLGDWFVYLVEELGEQQQQLASKDDLKSLATKDDLRLVIELMEKRFEAQQKEMNARFEVLQKTMDERFTAVNARFEAQQREMNARFEAIQKETNALRQENERLTQFEAMEKSNAARFEAMEKANAARFEAMEKSNAARFEALQKQFRFIQWFLEAVSSAVCYWWLSNSSSTHLSALKEFFAQ